MSTVVDGVSAGVGAGITRALRAHPVRLAFVASLLLSLVALLGSSALSRDAAYYLDIARQVNEDGLQAGWRVFDWPWFTFLLAGTHGITHLPLEWCANLWCALFMAGTCALLVDCVRQRVPAAAGWACLLVLAMPAINQFRDDIIREYGFWFFCVLALWLTMRWQVRGGWVLAAGMHLAVGMAALFRLEALMLVAALGAWQLVELYTRRNVQRFAQFVALPVLAVVVGLLIILEKGGLSLARVDYYLGLINPQKVFIAFRQLAEQFGNSLTLKYSRDEAGRIIFFGLLASLLIKFVALMGPFSLPFLHRSTWQAVRTYLREYQPFAWAGLLYLIVLMLFYIKLQFMNSRYLSFLNVLALPLLAIGAMLFAQRFARLAKVLAVIGLLVMLANVISTGAGKGQLVDSGRWIAEHIDPKASLYYEDSRIGYYAGRGYREVLPRDQAIDDAHVGNYSYFALEARADEPWLVAWLDKHQLRVLASFSNRKKATVLVIGR
ncbi:hypothetical protein [Pseudomonas guariconensis]|uniref:hypothetical protein n=1 Tax=Pseudomonas guariconensis TaxID=1288410 RepID=UPI002E20B9FA